MKNPDPYYNDGEWAAVVWQMSKYAKDNVVITFNFQKGDIARVFLPEHKLHKKLVIIHKPIMVNFRKFYEVTHHKFGAYTFDDIELVPVFMN